MNATNDTIYKIIYNHRIYEMVYNQVGHEVDKSIWTFLESDVLPLIICEDVQNIPAVYLSENLFRDIGNRLKEFFD